MSEAGVANAAIDRKVLAELKKWSTHAIPWVRRDVLAEIIGVRGAALTHSIHRLLFVGLVRIETEKSGHVRYAYAGPVSRPKTPSSRP